MRKLNWLWLVFLFLMPLISADDLSGMFGSSIWVVLLALVIFLSIEFFIFRYFVKKIFKVAINTGKSLLIIFVANVVSIVLMGVIPDLSDLSILLSFFIILIFVTIVEFGVYLLFFIKKNFEKLKLFWVALFVNLITTILIFALIFLNRLDVI